jgi:hypothetical protein
MLAQADAARLPLADQSVSLVIGSPPYLARRDYGIGAGRQIDDWVLWMLGCTREALRVSRGPVVWVVAGSGGIGYQPGPEWLLAAAFNAGLPVNRPCYWEANKPPSGKKWFTNVVEYVLCFGPVPHFDPSALATPLKYSSGGAFRQRGVDGARKAGSAYPTHKTRRTVPNLFRVPVGGGRMGHPLATENEAPYPVGVPARFVAALTRPGDLVLDPFSGGGSTGQACQELGRRYIGLDKRPCQCELARRRLATA